MLPGPLPGQPRRDMRPSTQPLPNNFRLMFDAVRDWAKGLATVSYSLETQQVFDETVGMGTSDRRFDHELSISASIVAANKGILGLLKKLRSPEIIIRFTSPTINGNTGHYFGDSRVSCEEKSGIAIVNSFTRNGLNDTDFSPCFNYFRGAVLGAFTGRNGPMHVREIGPIDRSRLPTTLRPYSTRLLASIARQAASIESVAEFSGARRISDDINIRVQAPSEICNLTMGPNDITHEDVIRLVVTRRTNARKSLVIEFHYNFGDIKIGTGATGEKMRTIEHFSDPRGAGLFMNGLVVGFATGSR